MRGHKPVIIWDFLNSWQFLLWGLSAVACYHLYLWRLEKTLASRLQREWSVVPTLLRKPKVSALVAAWNEQEHINAHIRSFLALAYPDIELILCAGGTDNTLECARQYAGERVVVLEQRAGEGKQRALARCLEHASGEIIYFTDADCIFVDEALTRLLAPLVDGCEQATTGTSRPLDEQFNKVLPYYLWASTVVYSIHSPLYATGMHGRNAAITRQALEGSGGLAFTATTGTDYQLAQRLIHCGIAIRQISVSVVPSEYPEALRVYRRQQSRWLRNLIIHGRRYGAKRDVFVSIKTVAIGALMVLFPLVSIFVGKNMLVLWSILATHAVTSKLRYALFTAKLYQRPFPPRFLTSLVPLTLVDFFIWALPIIDLFDSKKREQW